MNAWNNKVVVVTGAATGIGAATAALFSKNGAAVTLVDVNAEVGEANTRKLRESGARAHFVQADVSKEEQVAAIADETLAAFGRIDALVNNAGIMRRHERIEEWTLDEFRRVIDVNLTGLFITSRAMAPMMGRNGGGVIVNIASLGAVTPVPYSPCYAAAKAGVLGLTRSLAVMLQPHKVRVNAILPSLVDTPMTADAPARKSAPQGSMLSPEAVARAIRFASEQPDLNAAFFIVENGPKGSRLVGLEDPPAQTSSIDL